MGSVFRQNGSVATRISDSKVIANRHRSRDDRQEQAVRKSALKKKRNKNSNL